MSVFINRGVEYRIVIPSFLHMSDELKYKYQMVDNYILFLSVDQTDARLLKSNYYISQKDDWVSFYTISNISHIDPSNPTFDIDLSEFEIDILMDILCDLRKDGLAYFHGWYDITFVS